MTGETMSDIRELTIEIGGMTCDHCERTVAKALETVPGVRQVLEVSHAGAFARVEAGPEATPARIEGAVAKAGYRARVQPHGGAVAPVALPGRGADFDLLIVGGGSAGFAAAIKGAELGARVALAEARRILERNREMVRKTLMSQNELDTAQTAYDSAVSQLKAAEAQQEAAAGQHKSAMAQARLAAAQHMAAVAQVEQARAALQAAELDLQRTTIRAPVTGIVVSRNVDVGQTVAASLQAPTLFLIAQDLMQMQVDTNVSEADIGRVQIGQTVTFTVDAYQNTSFTGQVTQVRNAPITVQNVVTYDAVVQVANPDLRLKPGMTANVSFLIAERQNVVKVPTAALRFRPDGAAPEPSARTSQTPQRGGGGGGAAGRSREMQERLTTELSLTPEQQTRLSEVFQRNAQQARALREEESEERRQAMRRGMQTQTRTQIRELLTPEQRQKYEALMHAREEAQTQQRPGRVWVVGANGTPESRPVTLGIANDTHTEVVSGDLTSGQQVITGLLASSKAPKRTAPPGFGAGPRL